MNSIIQVIVFLKTLSSLALKFEIASVVVYIKEDFANKRLQKLRVLGKGYLVITFKS